MYYAVILFLVSIISFIILSKNFDYLMKFFNLKMPFTEYFGLTMANTMFNYYMPAKGGILVRAYYLKKKYNFEYSKYISMMGGNYYINSLIAILISLVLLLTIYVLFGNFYKNLFIISTSIATILLVIYFAILTFSKFSFKKNNKFTNFFNSVVQGLLIFNKNKKGLLYIFITQFLFIIFQSLRLYFSFLAIGIESNFLYVMIVQTLVVFSLVFSLTPGNIGIKEGIIGFLSSMLGVSMPDAILAATLDRAVAMIITFSLGIYFSNKLIKTV